MLPVRIKQRRNSLGFKVNGEARWLLTFSYLNIPHRPPQSLDLYQEPSPSLVPYKQYDP